MYAILKMNRALAQLDARGRAYLERIIAGAVRMRSLIMARA